MALDYNEYFQSFIWDEFKREKHLYEWEQAGDFIETGIGMVGDAGRNYQEYGAFALTTDQWKEGFSDLWKEAGEFQYGFQTFDPTGGRFTAQAGAGAGGSGSGSGSGLALIGLGLLLFFLLKG